MTAGNAQVTVTYTAPSNDGDSAITSYTVNAYTSLAPPILATSTLLSTTTPSPITVTGLNNGTPYYFSIYASNIRGAGIPSDISSTAVIPLGPPGPPRNITMTSIDYNSGTFSFLAPLNNGGSAVTNYTAEIYKNTDTTYATSLFNSSPTTVSPITFTVNQNTNGYQYVIKMTATSAIGTSMPIYTSIQIKQITKPDAPSLSMKSYTYNSTTGYFNLILSLQFFNNNGSTISNIQISNYLVGISNYTNANSYTFGNYLTSSSSYNSNTKIDINESQNFTQVNGYKYHFCIRLSTSLGYVYSNVLKFDKLASPKDSYYNLTSF